MKRALISVIALTAVVSAMGQSNFTIVRPADGAKVRENVRLLFPMNSIPEKDAYIGIYLSGKFLEAVKPTKGNTYQYYDLDTKKLGIPDGPVTVEAVLYQNFAEKPRIIDRSSIQVDVQNSASITVPPNGFALKYKFRPGQTWTYRVEEKTAINTLSEAMANSGSAGDLLLGADVEKIRLQYTVNNVYPDGSGLIRIQGLPEKGKNYAIISTELSPEATRYEDYQMAPVYMKVTSAGKELFGSIPRYFPISGSAGELSRTDMYAIWPLPVLSSIPRRPGDTWPSHFQVGAVDLEKADELTAITTKEGIPSRADFVGVEWEMGHPCARIQHTLETKAPKLPNIPAGSQVLNASKIQENIFFALDLGTVIKMTREYTIDTKESVTVASNRGSSSGAGAAGAGAPGSQGKKLGQGGAAAGASFGSGSAGVPGGGKLNLPDQGSKNDLFQKRPGPGFGGPGGQGGRDFGFPGPGGSMGGPQMGSGPMGNGGGNRTTTRINRITIQLSFILEQ